MEEYYYVEIDGMVYLTEEGGRLCFPKSRDELNFAIEVKHEMRVEGNNVLFCKPLIGYYPEDWWHKDKIPLLDQANPIVRKAINTSLPRVVVEGVIVEDSKILLVKSKRGYLKGLWDLPGGFVSYGESPEESVKREVEEETGAGCRVKSLLSIESFLGKETYHHWHMLFYEVELLGKEFHPASDEIEEVRWFEIHEAIKRIGGRVMQEKIRELYG